MTEIGCFNCCQRQDGSVSELEQLKGLILKRCVVVK